MNKHAQALGRLGKGKKKRITAEDSAKRAERLAEARKKRHPKKKEETNDDSRGK